MSITSEITRIQSNIENAYTALEAKGATMPITENSDSLATTISTITMSPDTATNVTNRSSFNRIAGDQVLITNTYGAGGTWSIVDSDTEGQAFVGYIGICLEDIAIGEVGRVSYYSTRSFGIYGNHNLNLGSNTYQLKASSTPGTYATNDRYFVKELNKYRQGYYGDFLSTDTLGWGMSLYTMFKVEHSITSNDIAYLFGLGDTSSVDPWWNKALAVSFSSANTTIGYINVYLDSNKLFSNDWQIDLGKWYGFNIIYQTDTPTLNVTLAELNTNGQFVNKYSYTKSGNEAPTTFPDFQRVIWGTSNGMSGTENIKVYYSVNSECYKGNATISCSIKNSNSYK